MYLHDSLFTFTTFFLSGFWLCGQFYDDRSDRVVFAAFITSALLTAVSWKLSFALIAIIAIVLFTMLLVYEFLSNRNHLWLLLPYSATFIVGVLLYVLAGRPTSNPLSWQWFDLLLVVYGSYIYLAAYVVARIMSKFNPPVPAKKPVN